MAARCWSFTVAAAMPPYFSPVSGFDDKSLVLTQSELGLGNNLLGIPGTGGLIGGSSQILDFGFDPALFGPPAGGSSSANLANAGATAGQGVITAAATTLTITTLKDVVDAGDGVLSLREALDQTNANPGSEFITFDLSLDGGVVKLKPGELEITDTTSFSLGPVDITISADNASRIFHVTGADTKAFINGFTLVYGNVSGDGGAVLAEITSLNCTWAASLSSTVRPQATAAASARRAPMSSCAMCCSAAITPGATAAACRAMGVP